MVSEQIVRSYRRLYKASLQVVHFSAPARFVVRDKLRQAYRQGVRSDFDQRSIDRTLEFLAVAGRETGIEHKIIRNILHVGFWGQKRS